jgi:DNA-repair protein complementing XP-A cells
MSSSSSSKLTDRLSAEELARIERNRQKALLVRQQKQEKLSTNQLFALEANNSSRSQSSGHDSGGGFLLDDEDDYKSGDNKESDINCDQNFDQLIECIECQQEFNKSFLFRYFSVKICDNCKDLKDRHSLITRTDAKTEYLLKDCDLDKRDPPLRYIAKKNPHQFARGDMRLYLRTQIEDRALEVWGSEQLLEEEREKRSGQRQKRKQKQYEKRLKSLRMTVRSSLYTKQTESHSHEFGEEVFNEDKDIFEKRCKSCGYLSSYEKM